jgi:hypothetical protein
VTPAAGAGAVDVRVTTSGGTSAISAADRFRFTITGSGGGGGGGGGGAGASAAPEPASFVGSKSSIRVSRKRRFKFSFHATPGLTGTAVFKSVKKVRVSRKKKVTLARKSFTVPDSGKVTLKIKLSKKKFRILKRNHKIRTRVTVVLEDSAGQTSKASRKITLKAPKRRH